MVPNGSSYTGLHEVANEFRISKMQATSLFRSLLFNPNLSKSGLHPVRIGVRSLATYGYSRRKKQLPVNTVINFVPQQEAWVIERFGKFYKILDPGLAFLIPIIDVIKYVQSLKEIAIEIPAQSAITQDNVTLHLDGVLYFRVVDPYKASYGVEDPEFAITQLAQTTMRSELGKITLDHMFQEREQLNHNIVESISQASAVWGIKCLRYEIRDIQLPKSVVEAMQMQVNAERKKRAAILESEGQREAAINVAEGKKRSQILESEGRKQEQINHATGEANAIVAKAKARAEGISKISESLEQQLGEKAASLSIAELYVAAFGNLAKTNNTVVLPANVGDAASMVAQALAVYGQMNRKVEPSKPAPNTTGTGSTDGGGDRMHLNEFGVGKVKTSPTESSTIVTSNPVSLNDSLKSAATASGFQHFTAATSPTRSRDFEVDM